MAGLIVDMLALALAWATATAAAAWAGLAAAVALQRFEHWRCGRAASRCRGR